MASLLSLQQNYLLSDRRVAPLFVHRREANIQCTVLLTLVQAGLSFEDLFFNSSSTAKAEAEVRRYTNVQAVQPFPGGAIMFLAQLFFLKRARYVSYTRKGEVRRI